jgi:hypothetical protein
LILMRNMPTLLILARFILYILFVGLLRRSLSNFHEVI